MAILNSNGVVLVTSIPTWTPTGDDATLARLQNTNTFWYWNGSAWTQFIAGVNLGNSDLTLSGDRVLDGDGNDLTIDDVASFLVQIGNNYTQLDTGFETYVEGAGGNSTVTQNDTGVIISVSDGVDDAHLSVNEDNVTLLHAYLAHTFDTVATGAASAALVRTIPSLESGMLEAFNEWIGTNANVGVGAQNNFTYYRGFNLDPNTGALIDPTKHGFGEGFEFWYEPVAGQVYVEKHLILNIAETVYRIDSHTLRIDSPASWSLYHTLNTWFLKSSIDDGQFFEIERSTEDITNLKLLASALVQRGASLQMTHDGTNMSLQIIPYGAATTKTLTMSAWDDAALPSLTSLNTPGDPNGKITFVFDRLYPNTDNDCELGSTGFRYKQTHTASLKVTQAASEATNSFEVTALGAVIANLPTHADEAAAVTASLATGTLYKTASGEVRIKL